MPRNIRTHDTRVCSPVFCRKCLKICRNWEMFSPLSAPDHPAAHPTPSAVIRISNSRRSSLFRQESEECRNVECPICAFSYSSPVSHPRALRRAEVCWAVISYAKILRAGRALDEERGEGEEAASAAQGVAKGVRWQPAQPREEWGTRESGQRRWSRVRMPMPDEMVAAAEVEGQRVGGQRGGGGARSALGICKRGMTRSSWAEWPAAVSESGEEAVRRRRR